MKFYYLISFRRLLFPAVTGDIAAAPSWQKLTMSLGSLGIDGGLDQSFYLGSLSGSPEFAFPLYLEHSLRVDDPVSEYKINQLESYVVPEGREEVFWVQPGGSRTVFKREEILKTEPERIEAEWVAVERSPLSYDFISSDGWRYRYEQGSLHSLHSPTGRQLFFETTGILISRIYQKTESREVTLLTASENDLGQPEEVVIGPVTHRFEYGGEQDLLAQWQASTTGYQAVNFSYNDDFLISSIGFPGGDKLTYAWGDRRGTWQQDSNWKLPEQGAGFFLTKDDHFSYRYGISKEGINLSRTDPAEFTDGFVYNPRTQKMVIKNRDGGEVTRFYGVRGEEYGRLESVRDPRGREAVSLTYDEEGRVKTRKVPGAAPLRYEYDAEGRLVEVYRLEELNQKFEYEGDSQKPSVITNALGHSIRVAYNEAGQVTCYQSQDGAVYEYEYDDLGQLVVEKWPMGFQRSIERDSFNRIVKEVNLDGSEARYEYTEENRMAVSQNRGEKWEYQYDDSGLLTQLNRDGVMWQKIEREKLDGLDSELVKNLDFKGRETTVEMSKEGRVKREVNPLGSESNFEYDSLGQMVEWKDESGIVAKFGHDALGRTTNLEADGGAAVKMAYDQLGRLTKKIEGSRETAFSYNKLGQLSEVLVGGKWRRKFSYDKFGRVVTAYTAEGVKTTYAWDVLDRKVSERNEIPNGPSSLVKWEYDRAGRKSKISAFDDLNNSGGSVHEIGYQYDLLGRYLSISVNGVKEIDYAYDERTMRLKSKAYKNGISVIYEHFQSGRPKMIKAIDELGEVLTEVSYVWGKDEKLISRNVDGRLHEYSYDDLGRLSNVTAKDLEREVEESLNIK